MRQIVSVLLEQKRDIRLWSEVGLDMLNLLLTAVFCLGKSDSTACKFGGHFCVWDENWLCCCFCCWRKSSSRGGDRVAFGPQVAKVFCFKSGWMVCVSENMRSVWANSQNFAPSARFTLYSFSISVETNVDDTTQQALSCKSLDFRAQISLKVDAQTKIGF